MNAVLMVGSGKGGAWKVRGEQLGTAAGATVEAFPNTIAGYDLLVLIKRRGNHPAWRAAQKAGLPVVIDIVDAWPRPISADWDRSQSMAWLDDHVAKTKPAAIVALTSKMADDCAKYGVPVLVLPDHARPGLRVNPVREKVLTVAYQGDQTHLGWWRELLETECNRRGWMFKVDHSKTYPYELADADIVVAVRKHSGYVPRNWKSNVKLANAQGSGTPVICNREAGYLDTASSAELWADDEREMIAALDILSDYEERRQRASMLLRAAPTLSDMAARYRKWLDGLCA